MNENLRLGVDELKIEMKSLKLKDNMPDRDIQCNLARMQELTSHIKIIMELERGIVAEYYTEILKRTKINPYVYGSSYSFSNGSKSIGEINEIN